VAAAGLVFTLVLEDEALDAADAPVLAWVIAHRGPGLTRAAELVSLYGGTASTGAAAVVAAVVMLWRGHRRWALVWVVGVLVGSLTIRLLKIAVERPRPPVADRLAVETTASLPSGHALMSALGLGLVAAAVLTSAAPRAVRAAVTVLAVLLAGTIGASRVYLGVHWTTDVTAGWLLGAALAVACLTVARVLDARGTPAPPEPVADPAGPAVDDGSTPGPRSPGR
jgi:undecaprenyl-diphosphatase